MVERRDARKAGADGAGAVSVSVIIPCHNAAEYLADALASVRDQTLASLECIVVNDASDDGSDDIARQFGRTDPRFRLIAGSGRGVSAARNAGIAAAKGQWIAMLDADDLFASDRLEVLFGIGEREAAEVVVDDQLITEYPRTTSTQKAFGFRKEASAFSQEYFFAGSRLFQQSFPLGYMKPLIRRDFIQRIAAEYDPSVPSGEDFLFYAKLFAARPRAIATNYAGYVYRRRKNSVSGTAEHLHLHAGLGDRVLDELGEDLSAESRQSLATRRRDLQQLANAMPAMSAVRARDLSTFVRVVTSKPTTVLTSLRLAKLRATRRLSAMRAASPIKRGRVQD